MEMPPELVVEESRAPQTHLDQPTAVVDSINTTTVEPAIHMDTAVEAAPNMDTPVQLVDHISAPVEVVGYRRPAMDVVDTVIPSREVVENTNPASAPLDNTNPTTEPIDNTNPSTEPIYSMNPTTEPVYNMNPAPEPIRNMSPTTQAIDSMEPARAPIDNISPIADVGDSVNTTTPLDDSMNTTITASSVVPLPEFQPTNNGSSGYTPEPHRPSTSYSDTGYQYSTHNGPRFNTSSDVDTPPRHSYYDASKETHMGQSQSRPSSQMGRYPTSEGGSRSNSYQDQNQRGAQQQPEAATKNASVVIKVGMVGDAQIGKTSLMVKYVEGSWDEDYIQTLGVNFMEKTISIRNTEITFSIWDLGGQREFVNMLPLVCNDAVAILFMFDLTRKSTLNSIKEWYRQGRGFNKTAIPFLVGTKYDHFVNFPREEQEEISNQAKRFARAMKASLIFSSTSHSINVQKIFKIVLSKAFDLKCTIPEIENIGEPLLLYQAV